MPTHAAAHDAGRSPKLFGIEASRGIAATLVVLYHVSRHLDQAFNAPGLKQVFQFGHAGVDFFFVISGFIILFVHYGDIGDPARATRYLGRRFTRVLPTYWVALLLTVALAITGHHGVSPGALFWSASLLPSNVDMVLGVAWTLQFEILFYAVFCVLILNRTAGVICLTLWFAAAVFAATTGFKAAWLPSQFCSPYVLQFFIGMTVAWLLKTHQFRAPLLILTAGLALFAGTALLEDLQLLDGYASAARLGYGIPAALIVIGIVEANRRDRLHVPAVLRSLGAASYSIYLFQFVFIALAWQTLLVTRLATRLPLSVEFVALALIAAVGGVVMSGLIEQPLLRLMRRRHRTPALQPKAS